MLHLKKAYSLIFKKRKRKIIEDGGETSSGRICTHVCRQTMGTHDPKIKLAGCEKIVRKSIIM